MSREHFPGIREPPAEPSDERIGFPYQAGKFGGSIHIHMSVSIRILAHQRLVCIKEIGKKCLQQLFPDLSYKTIGASCKIERR